MRLLSFLFIATIMTGLASFSSAGYKMSEDRVISSESKKSIKQTQKIKFPDYRSSKEDLEKEVLKELSVRYALPVDRLEYFRRLHHGYEEIVPALVVAREAQVEAGRVLQMRMEERTWKDIAQEFSIELKPLNKEVVEVLEPIKKTLPKQAITERPQTRE